MYERRHEKIVTDRASRGHRDHTSPGGVSDAHAPVDAAGVADHGPHGGRCSGRRLVPPDLSHRAEVRIRMAQITASVVLAIAVGVAPLAGQTSLSIYSDGRVVVRRTLTQALQKGRNTFTLKVEGLDGATLFSPDTAVALVSAVVRPPTVPDAAPAAAAEGQLVAGSINRARPEAPAPQANRARGFALADVVVTTGEQAVGETHVYQLPGKLSLDPGTPTTTALFPRSAAAYTQELIVPGALPWRGFPGQAAADDNRVPVQVWYTLKRGRGTPFGERPLPGGTVQLYQADSAGRFQLVGEARSDHTAPGRDLRVRSGDAFDVTAERVQTDYTQEQLAPPKRGMTARQRITAAYRVTISNAKPAAVTVDVREARFGVWRVTESSVPAEKISTTEVRFRVPVPTNGDATLTYTVQAES